MGTVRINTGQLLTDADRAKKAFQTISQAGREIGTGVTAGSKQAQASLTSLQVTAAGVARTIAGAFALPTMIGFTQELKRSEFQLKLFSKDTDDFNKRIKQAHDLAEDLKQPYDQILATFATLSSMAKRYNLDLAETTTLVQRLTLISPEQGAEGSRIALQEFISGDITSLSRRFELNRNDLRKILDQSNGDIRIQMQLFDEYIASLGFTNDALVEMGKEGFNTFARLKSEVKETTAEAFEPMLNNAIIPLVEGTGDLLRGMRELNPALLEIGGTLGGILATVLALNAAGMGSPGLNKLAVAGGALYAGSEIGTAIVRGAAESGTINNSRLENVSQEEAKKVIAEYLKQATVLFADQLVEIAFKLVEGAITIDNAKKAMETAFDALKNTFEAANVVVDIGFDNVKTVLENAADKMAAVIELAAIDIDNAFRTMLEAIGQLIIDLPGDFGLDERGQNLINSARSGGTSEATRNAVATRAGQDVFSGVTDMDAALADLEAKARAFEEILANMDIGLTDAQRQNLEITKQEFKEKFIVPIAEGLGLLQESAGSWVDRLREGLGGGGGTAPVVEPEEFTEEMLEAFGKFQQELADLEKKAADDRTKANAEANKKRTEAAAKLEKDISSTIQDSEQKRADILKKANTDNIQSEQDHRDRLADIRRSADRDAERAAARFDAAGVFNARQREQDAVDDEQRTHEKERERRQEAIAEELIDLETAKQQRLEELRSGYREELLAINQQRQEKINQINAQLRDEIQQRNQAFAETHNRLVAEAREAGNHNVRMLNIQGQGLAAQEAAYRAWITRMGGYVPQTAPQQVRQAQNTVQDAANRLMNSIPSFASGTGNTGMGGLARLHPNEIVLDAPTSAMVRSMIGSDNPSQPQMRGALAAGNSTSNKYEFNGSLHFGDVGGYSERQLKALFMESQREYMEAMANA